MMFAYSSPRETQWSFSFSLILLILGIVIGSQSTKKRKNTQNLLQKRPSSLSSRHTYLAQTDSNELPSLSDSLVDTGLNSENISFGEKLGSFDEKTGPSQSSVVTLLDKTEESISKNPTTDSLETVRSQLDLANSLLEKFISSQKSDENEVFLLRQKIETLEAEQAKLKEQNDYLATSRISAQQQNDLSKDIEAKLVEIQEEPNLEEKQEKLEEIKSNIAFLKAATVDNSEVAKSSPAPSDTLQSHSKDEIMIAKAQASVEQVLEIIDQMTDLEAKSKVEEEVKTLIKSPSERVKTLIERFKITREKLLNFVVDNMLEDIAKENNTDMKRKILDEIKALKNDPSSLNAESRETLLKEELIARVPESCRNNLRVAMELGEFDKSVAFARKGIVQISSLIGQNHVDELMTATFVDWLGKQLASQWKDKVETLFPTSKNYLRKITGKEAKKELMGTSTSLPLVMKKNKKSSLSSKYIQMKTPLGSKKKILTDSETDSVFNTLTTSISPEHQNHKDLSDLLPITQKENIDSRVSKNMNSKKAYSGGTNIEKEIKNPVDHHDLNYQSLRIEKTPIKPIKMEFDKSKKISLPAERSKAENKDRQKLRNLIRLFDKEDRG